MNVYEVKKVLQHKPITDIPLRVVSYCRVSTKSLEQATSIENQVEQSRVFRHGHSWANTLITAFRVRRSKPECNLIK